MVRTLHIRLFGQFQAIYEGESLEALSSPRLQFLLAYLLLRRGTPQSRQHIAFTFWPDSTESQARTNLRTLLYKLRQALPDADAYLHADAQTVRWCADGPYSFDVADLEDSLTDVAAAESVGDAQAARQALPVVDRRAGTAWSAERGRAWTGVSHYTRKDLRGGG
jgi:DNA-binding SARP family transcriptional activator